MDLCEIRSEIFTICLWASLFSAFLYEIVLDFNAQARLDDLTEWTQNVSSACFHLLTLTPFTTDFSLMLIACSHSRWNVYSEFPRLQRVERRDLIWTVRNSIIYEFFLVYMLSILLYFIKTSLQVRHEKWQRRLLIAN